MVMDRRRIESKSIYLRRLLLLEKGEEENDDW